MTVNTLNSSAEFQTNGATTVFPIGFKFLNAEDLDVTFTDANGVTTALMFGTDYTVSGAGEEGGGSITTSSALGQGQLAIERDMTAYQVTSIRNQGRFFAEVHESVFDRLTMLIQQAFSRVNRALLRPLGKSYYDAQSRQIKNVADPADLQDAATRRWSEGYVASVLATGQGPINNAANIVYVGFDGSINNLQSLSGPKGAELIGWRGRPVSESLLIYPEHFGAKGDGITDDSAAYQLALDSLPEYGVLYHRAGSVYRLFNGVSINKKGTTIVGYGGKVLYPKTTEPFFHCYRVNAQDVSLMHLEIDSPSGLVRDDTGFAISVGAYDNTLIQGCTIRRTASAAIWVTNATGVRVSDNYIWFPLADGIHFSDGSRNFVCADNVITGTHDDAIAVVGDVPGDSLIPFQGAVTGNTIDGTLAGHGIALIACDSINVTGNTMRSTAYAGIGSYFWRLTTTPTALDWASNCLISDNLIIAPGSSPMNGNNNCGIFAGALRNSIIRNNKIHGPSSESIAPASVIRVLACQGLTIESNEIRDSLSYGIWSPDNNINEAINHAELTIHGNRFYNIAKEIVRISTLAPSVGDTIITQNRAYKCGYSSAVNSLITVTKVAGNLLNMTGNVNVDGAKSFFFDPATCTNVRAGDNNPETPIAFNPSAVATTNSWTSASSAGSFVERGNLIFFRVRITVTTKGTGTGARFTLPKPMRSGSPPVVITGRETVGTGVALNGYADSLNTATVVTFNNGDPTTGNGQIIDVSGWYERA